MFNSSNSSSGSSSSRDGDSRGDRSGSTTKDSSNQDATPIVETVLRHILLLMCFNSS